MWWARQVSNLRPLAFKFWATLRTCPLPARLVPPQTDRKHAIVHGRTSSLLQALLHPAPGRPIGLIGSARLLVVR